MKEALKQRFLIFQKLLSSNNNVLELMADMSEKLSAEFLFDRSYLEQNTRKISDGVRDIVINLNKLSDNNKLLDEQINIIDSKIEDLLTRKYKISEDVYIMPFEDISKKMIESFGGKNANLGEVRNHIGLPAPEGFAISSYAFMKFMEHNGFLDKIEERLKVLSIQNSDELTRISRQIQDMVVRGKIPDDLKEAIVKETGNLMQKTGISDLKVSVRSSALHEDSEFSFAGQYYTFLNVPVADIIQRYKEVVASLFTPRAIFYFKSKGIQEYDMVMSVGILRMIDAVSGGVIYTSDPNKSRNDDIIISAVHGLGKCVVDGTITPEMYTVTRHPDIAIAERNIPMQKKMLFCRLDGEVGEIPLPEAVAGKPSLTDEQIKLLSEYAIAIEKHYRCPQDIEWAIAKDGNPLILQTRPLRIIEKENPKTIPTHVNGYNVLINKGIIACKGLGLGIVHIVKTDEDLKNFPDNAVLVVRHTSPKYVTVMHRASAIVTDFGGTTGHMASLAREFQVATILDTQIGTEILKNGQEVTVDAFNCTIYEGKVEELMEFSGKRADPFKETQIYKLLQKVMKLIVPLNLSDPDAPNFRQEYCETFHDITRFCHEKAMLELFDIVGTSADDVGAVKFVSDIPIEIWMLDLDDGIGEFKGFVKPQDLRSGPYISFFKGLSSMRWPQGQAVDAKGFLDSRIRTVTLSEEELKKAGEKSFLVITKEYMNFAIRLGYHLSSVEAFAGENTNDNYIKFFFKGGGSIVDRKLRRARLIKEILENLDFDVKITEDIVNASLMKYKKSQIEERLEVMGKLTVFTKQLDMVMYNDSITDCYIAGC
ncbi:MAG TPA: PEP/pyruvate-binding domain-containing protein [Dissulfurispiraceae bacterium]|nr:PEP/pyruvate-binding domain-containing protein [Dissulfurispiraceae bacterium]